MEYGQGIELSLPYPEAVRAVKAALKEQGFGVLTEIDVKATMREKIDRDIEDYVILGACNPHLASRALDVDRRIGLLLPGNVVVRDGGNGRTVVEVLDPHVMVAVPERDELAPVADEAARLLSAALSALSADNPAAAGASAAG